jgi:hypothetical protein
MTHLYSLICLSLGAVAYCISQLQIQGKLTLMNTTEGFSFWGVTSWRRKYDRETGPKGGKVLIQAPTTWYYKLFNLKYKERFPGSATVFVALTDGYHLMQFLFLLLISGAIAVHTENWLLWLLIYRAVFGVTFTIFYKWLAR